MHQQVFDVAEFVAGHAEALVAALSADAGEGAVGQVVGDEEEVLGVAGRPGSELEARAARGGSSGLHLRDRVAESLWNCGKIRRGRTK